MRPLSIPGERSTAPPWPLLPVAAALVAAWAILAWPWLSGRVTIPWDAKAHFQPQIQFLAQSLARGESPFWAPYVFSGHPQVADPQSLIFSPPFLLLALVDPSPSLLAVDTTVYLTILAGGLALVLWFRDRGWHWAGALVAALGFGFGAAMAWRIQHTGQVLSLAYLPIVLVLLDRALARRSVPYGAAAGLTAAAMVLGRDQVALLGVYLLAGYVAWHWLAAARPAAELRATLGPLVAGGIAGALVIALPVLMTALVAADSNRPAIDYIGAGRGSLHPALLLTLVAPDLFGSSGEMARYWGPPSMVWQGTELFIAQNVGQLYVGAVPLILILMAAARGALAEREIRFWLAALAAMTIYALGWYTPLFRLMHGALPGVDLYRRPADAVFLMGFIASLIAGYGAHRLLATAWPPVGWRHAGLAALPVVAAFAIAVALAIHFGRLGQATPPLAEAAALMAGGGAAIAAAVWLAPLRPVAAGLVLAAFTVLDLAVANGPGGATALPPAHYEVLEPGSRNETIALLKQKVAEGRSDTRRDRVELVGLGFHWPNASLTHGLENTLGYNPVRLADYGRATGAEDHSVSTADRKLPPLFPSYRSPLADLLGLRFIASGAPIETADKTLKPGDLTLLARTADGYVYENRHALPRVLFATATARADFEHLMATGAWPAVDLATTVVLDGTGDPSPAAAAPRRPGSVRIASYRNTEVVIEADSPDGGYVVLNDIWHRWWRVEIGGSPAELLRANVLFRAVAVPPGRHRVRFVFQPVRGALADLLGGPTGPIHPVTQGGRQR